VTLSDFLAEATRLAKPCKNYRFAKAGEQQNGYWHGVAAGELCVSIEREGKWLNVYLDEEYEAGRVELSVQPILSDRPLVRTAGISLPPIDAVFRFGSETVGRYLDANGWKREWAFNDNFKGDAAHEYNQEWSRQCPLYYEGVVATEAGWNIPWPDGDWDGLLSHEFVLWTFEESEPWVEVFHSNSGYSVFQRIT